MSVHQIAYMENLDSEWGWFGPGVLYGKDIWLSYMRFFICLLFIDSVRVWAGMEFEGVSYGLDGWQGAKKG